MLHIVLEVKANRVVFWSLLWDESVVTLRVSQVVTLRTGCETRRAGDFENETDYAAGITEAPSETDPGHWQELPEGV